MTSPFVGQLSDIRGEVAALKKRRTTLKKAEVTAVDDVAFTFTADVPGAGELAGIPSPAKFLPEVGDVVTLQVEGATPTYLPGGIAANAIGGREISGVPGGLIESDTVTANLGVLGSLLTAFSGQRSGLTPIGIQAWDDGENETVRLDGAANLIQGTIQTAPDGSRRIVLGAAGTTGQIKFIGDDGSLTELRAYTSDTGVEAIRMSASVDESWEGWNAVQLQANERAYLSSKIMQHIFTAPGSEGQGFVVSFATNTGSAGVPPTRTERFTVGEDLIRMFVGTVSADGSVDIIPHGVADTRQRSPKILLRGEGGSVGHHIKYVNDSGPTNARIEITNAADSGYAAIWASAFTVSSSEVDKQEIADLPAGRATQRVRQMRPRVYRRVSRGGVLRGDNGQDVEIPETVGPPEIGLVAQEAPGEVVAGQSEAINLYSLAVLAIATAKELDARLTQAEARLAALEAKIP